MQNLFNLLEFIKKVFLSVTKPIPGFFTVLQSSEGNCKLKIKDVTGKDLVVDFGGKRVGSDNGSLFLYDASLRYFDKKIESPEDMDIALNLLREVQSFLFRNHQDVYNRCASSLGVALPPVLPSLPTSAAAAASSSTISALAPIPQPRHIPVPVVVRVSVELGARFIKLYNTVDSLQQRAQEVEISSSVGRSKVQAIFYNAFHKCVLLHEQGKTCGLICGCGEITYYEEGLGDESSRIYYNNHGICSNFVNYLLAGLSTVLSSAAATSQATGTQRQPSGVGLSSQASFFTPAPARDTAAVAPERVPSQQLSN